MPLLLIVSVPLALALLFTLLYRVVKRRAQRLADNVRQQYGDTVKLVCGCGIVNPPNRVPGVIALTGDRIVYRSTIAAGSEDGEALLAELRAVEWEDSNRSRHRMARKYRNARALGITTGDDVTKVFVLSRQHAPAWERELPAR